MADVNCGDPLFVIRTSWSWGNWMNILWTGFPGRGSIESTHCSEPKDVCFRSTTSRLDVLETKIETSQDGVLLSWTTIGWGWRSSGHWASTSSSNKTAVSRVTWLGRTLHFTPITVFLEIVTPFLPTVTLQMFSDCSSWIRWTRALLSLLLMEMLLLQLALDMNQLSSLMISSITL